MINPFIFNPDKLGFYSVGQFKTHSKIEAIEMEKILGVKSEWNFNNEVFSKFDWTVEPEIDVWSLYKLRAQQIRNEYDYVVLFYSGGSDSQNMLDAWIAADCKIDEIATFWDYDGSKDRHSFFNAETTMVVMPKVEKLKNQGLNFKFRLIDSSKFGIDNISNYQDDYQYMFSHFLSITTSSRAVVRDKITDYQNIINSGKKLCFVWAAEKPTVGYDGITYHVSLYDSGCAPYINSHVLKNYSNGWYDELFYWTPDLPLLPIKQAHIVKNFMKNNTEIDFSKSYYKFGLLVGYHKILKQFIPVTEINNVLYPTWKSNTFSVGKVSSSIFSEKDMWFHTGNIEETKIYRSIVKKTLKTIGGDWIKFKSIKSQEVRYYLE